jgi:aspartate aminotransferase
VGAKHVIFNAFMATINPGDEVILPAPYWVSYPDMIAFAGGVSVPVLCAASDGFKLRPESLKRKITNKTKWLVLNSPSNPTGAAYSRDELRAILEIVKEYPNLHILSDDIYEHIVYDNFKFCTPAQVMPELTNRILTVNGVSKAYAMTGWRIGYAGGPKHLIKAIQTIQSQSTSNPCSISQEAAVEALSGTQHFIKPNTQLFQIRRDLMISEFNSIPGLSCSVPHGAFYAFPSCEKLIGAKTKDGKIINNDVDFAEYLLEKALVAVVPGSAFGIENFFRTSYATSNDLLQEACDRIREACSALTIVPKT